MKKRVYSIILAAALTFTAAGVTQIPAMAETNVNSEQTADLLDGTVTDSLDLDSARWYRYTMPSTDGHVHFTLTGSDIKNKFRLYVYAPDDAPVAGYIVETSPSNSINTREFAFEPGTTIYLKVYSYSGDLVSNMYTLESDFTTASDWENDYTNDKISGADTLTTDTAIYGVCIYDWDADWYKYDVPSNGKVTFKLKNTGSVSYSSWGVYVYDSKKELFHTYTDPSDHSYTTDSVLGKAGETLYVKIIPHTYYIWGYPAVTYQLTPHLGAVSSDDNTSNSDDSVPVPAKVTGVKISNSKGPGVKVSFTDQDDANGYQISFSYNGVTNKMNVRKASAKIYVPKGKKVTVKVRAYNYNDKDEKQYGSWSATVSKKTDRK